MRALVAHLDTAQADQLAAAGDLPAGLRAQLAADLRAQLAACAAYIPARLVYAQLADPQPGRTSGAFWDGSLLFADLSGFTALSERLSVLGRQGAEEVSAVVNRLFAALIAEVQIRQGALLKFGGDALTVFFDAQALGPNHATAACAAALAMQQRMAEFADLPTRAGVFTLRLRVGVHAGRVFAAEVGDASHIELVVTGPEVNRVALAQEIAAPGEVVITSQTADLLEAYGGAPRDAGFLLLTDLAADTLPPPPPDPIALRGPDDLATLDVLARQLAALRPYLVHSLPRRFLEAAASELGEFRPVTVLFANFHNFSACLAGLAGDAPRAAAVLNAYYRRAQAVVHRYDGIVNKVDMYTHGDKLMALFGAPTAHEDDPTRAVRCALDLAEALAAANAEIGELLGAGHAPLALAQKIGINAGTVFAGRVGGVTRYEYTAMGPAVNLAARLMSAAHDGDVLLSPSAHAAVGGQFITEEGAPLSLKGLAAPVVPARALRVSDLGSRRDETRLAAAPLIGRDAELASLLAAAGAALRGQGATIALVGEAGAGKSRLAEELLQRLVVASVPQAGADPALRVPPFAISLGDCQSYDQRTAYAALRAPLTSLLGISLRASPAAAAAQVAAAAERVASLAPAVARFTPLLADALGLPFSETPLTAGLSAEQRHDRLQDLLVALFLAAADREPLLVALEDIHWADSPSLELIGRLARDAVGRPLLLSLTYRPDPPIPAPWDAQPTTAHIDLGELPPPDSEALLAALLGGPPPAEILPLLERTQGNPFFIEELVRALISGDLLVRPSPDALWALARPLREVELPKSIEGLLIARLDRLDEPRQELVQVASVIGRRFQRPVVEGIYASSTSLDESLGRLVEGELIQAEQQDRALSYLFRHALLRDVAYEGILYARRRALHARVAQRIEQIAADRLDEQFALLAWHQLQAEAWPAALRYHLLAAEQARRRFANRDALALYSTALSVAPQLATSLPPAQLVEQVAAIHEALGDLHLLLGEYEPAARHYHEALDLSHPASGPVSERWLRMHRMLATVEERRSQYQAAFDLLRAGMDRTHGALRSETARCYLLGAGISYRTGDYAHAMEWARIGGDLAAQAASVTDQARALKIVGNVANDQGDRAQAIEALDRARTLYEQANMMAGLCDVLNDLGRVYTQAGRWQETIASFERSLAISENIGDVLATARTANNLAVVLVGRDELGRAAELYQLSSEMFGRIGSRLGVAVTTYNRGEVLLNQGQPAAALPLFTATISELEAINARSFLPEVLRLAALAALALADLPTALALAARSLETAEDLGQADDAAIARRVLGEIALARPDLAAAADLLAQSGAALAQLDNRYELGKTRYQQARLALARHDMPAAAAARAEAIQIFAALDAQRDLALAQDLPSVG